MSRRLASVAFFTSFAVIALALSTPASAQLLERKDLSYAMALSADRPAPAGVLALSGFIPTVPGWEPQFADRQSMRVLISHGRLDPVIPVQFGQRAREDTVDGLLRLRESNRIIRVEQRLR